MCCCTHQERARKLAGVLDISSEGVPFTFDAASVVGWFAQAMENRLLVVQSVEHLVVRFQITSALLDSPSVGLAGIDSRGQIAWLNGIGSRLLGLGLSGDGLHLRSGSFATRSQDGSEPNTDMRLNASLRGTDRDLIDRTMLECGGNVSEAARRLGVSRGRVIDPQPRQKGRVRVLVRGPIQTACSPSIRLNLRIAYR